MQESPSCKGARTVEGAVHQTGDKCPMGHFRPSGMRWWMGILEPGVETRERQQACLGCGMLWSSVRPRELADFIRAWGKAETLELCGFDGAQKENRDKICSEFSPEVQGPQCPECGSPRLAAGLLHNVDPRWGRSSFFRPAGLRWGIMPMRPGAQVREPMHACLKCGFVWGSVVPQKLAEFIIKHGTKETRQKNGLA